MQSERLTAAVTALAEAGVPVDVQELLLKNNALGKAIEAALSTDAEPVAFTNAAQLKKLSDPSRWHEATICPVGDGAYDIPLYAEPVKTAPAVALTRLAIRTGGSCANVYAYTEADDDGDYVFYTEALSALSAQVQDVAGWQPIETAPKDGKHCLLAVKSDCFVYAVQGAFMMGKWENSANIESEPLCWMPLTRIPQVFLPWTVEFAAAAPAAKQGEGE